MPKRKRISGLLVQNASLSFIDAHYEQFHEAGKAFIGLVKAAFDIFFADRNGNGSLRTIKCTAWSEFKRGMTEAINE